MNLNATCNVVFNCCRLIRASDCLSNMTSKKNQSWKVLSQYSKYIRRYIFCLQVIYSITLMNKLTFVGRRTMMQKTVALNLSVYINFKCWIPILGYAKLLFRISGGLVWYIYILMKKYVQWHIRWINHAEFWFSF